MKKPFHNDSDNIAFVGGKLIPPGEIRMVDMPVASNKPAFDIAALLENKVSDLPEALSTLNIDTLNKVLAFEQTHGKRKGAISAIEEQIAQREYDADLTEFASSLSATEDLDALMLLVADDENKVAMVEEEIARRKEQVQNDNQQD